MDRLYYKYSPCSKCGETHANTVLRNGVMVRGCNNCGNVWNERPLDEATPAELLKMAESQKKDLPEKAPG